MVGVVGRQLLAVHLIQLNVPMAPVISPVAAIVVLDVILLPLVDPFVVIFQFVVDILPNDVIVPPVIVPSAATSPAGPMTHLSVHPVVPDVYDPI